MRSAFKRTAGVGGAVLSVVLVLASCSQSGAGGGGGEGVAFGATHEEYVAAFEDVDPLELSFQSGTSPDATQSWATERYAEALSDWSGGKIDVEITYGSAIAPAIEGDDALADGRLGFGGVLSLYEPDKFPVANLLNSIGFLQKSSDLVGMLQGYAAWAEVALETPELAEEYLDHGIQPALTHAPGANPTLLCTEERTTADDLEEVQTRASGTVHVAEAEGLGMSPVSLDLSEVYEGLQRGIVDCSIQHLVGAKFSGYLELTPYVLQDPEAQFASTFTGTGYDAQLWDELPLIVRQLLWDRLDVFWEWTLSAHITDVIDAQRTILGEGGTIQPFDAETRQNLKDANAEVLDSVRAESELLDGEDLVDRAVDANERWLAIVQELGYTDASSAEELAEWFEGDQIDFGPYIETFSDEVLKPHRPS